MNTKLIAEAKLVALEGIDRSDRELVQKLVAALELADAKLNAADRLVRLTVMVAEADHWSENDETLRAVRAYMSAGQES